MGTPVSPEILVKTRLPPVVVAACETATQSTRRDAAVIKFIVFICTVIKPTFYIEVAIFDVVNGPVYHVNRCKSHDLRFWVPISFLLSRFHNFRIDKVTGFLKRSPRSMRSERGVGCFPAPSFALQRSEPVTNHPGEGRKSHMNSANYPKNYQHVRKKFGELVVPRLRDARLTSYRACIFCASVRPESFRGYPSARRWLSQRQHGRG